MKVGWTNHFPPALERTLKLPGAFFVPGLDQLSLPALAAAVTPQDHCPSRPGINATFLFNYCPHTKCPGGWVQSIMVPWYGYDLGEPKSLDLVDTSFSE
jgi:hypothetical protein